jgi:hypothetical protein
MDGGGAYMSFRKRQRPNDPGCHFVPCSKLCYHGDSDGQVVTSSFLSAEACEHIVGLCEQHASTQGWQRESQAAYSYATEDLEVEAVPALAAWLRASGLLRRAADRIERAHGARITALDDCFVVKYSAARQRALARHVDAGDVSFMVALSRRGVDYDGGGTHFEVQNRLMRQPTTLNPSRR